MQILILGMHRSGTSLITRMVNMMGAYVGPEGSMLELTQDNPKGYWERNDVLNYNIFLLRLHGVDWAGYNPAPWPMPCYPRELPPPLLTRLQALVFNMDAHRPWVMKDPRLCITLPYWKKLLEVPVCVVVHRDPLEIAESLNRIRHARNPVPHERGLALWEFYTVALLNASVDLPRVFVDHADFFRDPIAATARLYHGLVAQGLQALRLPSDREINAFIDPGLYRSKPKEQVTRADATGSAALALTDRQRELTTMLLGQKPHSSELAVSEESMRLLQQPIELIDP